MTEPTPPGTPPPPGTPAPTGSTPPATPATPPRTDARATALTRALAAEHAAIFAYGPIGVRLDGELAEAARAADAAHRSRRDDLLLTLAAEGAAAPGPEVSYALPFALTDAHDALRLAVLVEERVAAVWRAVLRETSGTTRAAALEALVDAAIRATGWRSAAGIAPATVPFPGTS